MKSCRSMVNRRSHRTYVVDYYLRDDERAVGASVLVRAGSAQQILVASSSSTCANGQEEKAG